MIHEYFPPLAPALQEEIQKHPRLQKALSELPEEASLEERIAMVFAYCGMVVDGYYNNDALEKLFGIALGRLKKMSTITIH